MTCSLSCYDLIRGDLVKSLRASFECSACLPVPCCLPNREHEVMCDSALAD